MSNRSRWNGFLLGFSLIATSLAPAAPDTTQQLKSLAEARFKIARSMIERSEEIINMRLPHPANPYVRNREWAERFALWSSRWMEAERESAGEKKGRIDAIEAHLRRLRKHEEGFVELAKEAPGDAEMIDIASILTFHRLQGESRLVEEKAGR